MRGTLISNRYIQFETFVESGSCDDGACYVNPYRLNANAASAPKTGSSRLLRRTVLEFPTHPQCEDLSYHGDVMYPNLDVVFMANDEGVDLFTAQAFRKMCEVEENIMGQTNWNNYCKGGADAEPSGKLLFKRFVVGKSSAFVLHENDGRRQRDANVREGML